MSEQRNDTRNDRNASRNEEIEGPVFTDRVVNISRVAKVVKGGRRFSFSALIVVGDGNGKVGYGLGKAGEVPDAIKKGALRARKNLINVPIVEGTVPHDVLGKYGASKVLMRTARAGTGVIAGGVSRAVFEAAGIHNILSKCIGPSNPHNVIKATFEGLLSLRLGRSGQTKAQRLKRLEVAPVETVEKLFNEVDVEPIVEPTPDGSATA